MSSSQKDLIIAYRAQGLPYREIAKKTHTSETFCRTVWSRNELAKKQEVQTIEKGICRYCGNPVDCLTGAKPKQFCSSQCRDKYFNRAKKREAYNRWT